MTAPLSAWSKLPLLLCLLLLAPRVGLAAQDTPDMSTDSEVPVTDEEAPQEQEVQAESESFARPERWRIPLGVRLLGEAGGGLLTSAGASLAGGLLGFGLCELTDAQGPFVGCAWAAAVGFGVGAIAGYPLGVWWGGEALGGDGKLFSAFAGMGVGIAASLLLGVASQQFDPGGRVTGPISGLLVLAGPIVFYELSQRREPGSQAEGLASAARPRLQPLLSVSPNGALLGLGGTF
jgi:hypothetical protein